MSEDKYDLDQGAADWARAKVENTIERIEQHAAWLDEHGRDAEARGMRKSIYFLSHSLVGGEGCVIAGFDHRLADMLTSARQP